MHPGLLDLSVEVRLEIYSYVVVSARPFLIGRCQDRRDRKTEGSPRDFFPGKHAIKRDDRPNRPVQHPITRACRLIREEALPVFYAENEFWLIHNEFRSDEMDGNDRRQRAFEPWLEQTPRKMFDLMQNISLCGYMAWPSRIKIDLNLKRRELTKMQAYSTYGDQLPLWNSNLKGLGKRLEESMELRGYNALRLILAEVDFIFDLGREHVSAPPGLSRLRQPMSGPEYDF